MDAIIERKEDIIRRFAYNFYQIRLRCGIPGDATQDWLDGVDAYESYKTVFKLKEA
jgi:hypothetical protein